MQLLTLVVTVLFICLCAFIWFDFPNSKCGTEAIINQSNPFHRVHGAPALRFVYLEEISDESFSVKGILFGLVIVW